MSEKFNPTLQYAMEYLNAMVNKFLIDKHSHVQDHAVLVHTLYTRAEAAEADAKRLAAELELEQNPGYRCEALRLHDELVKGGEG